MSAGDWPDDNEDTENKDDVKNAVDVLQYKVRAGVRWPCLMATFQVFEAMFRVIKESENVDERQHCFLIQTFGQQSHYFSVETRQVGWCLMCSMLDNLFSHFRSCSVWSLPGTRPHVWQSLTSAVKLFTWFTRTDLPLSHWVGFSHFKDCRIRVLHIHEAVAGLDSFDAIMA